MSHTGLAFYRRSQTMDNLATERPKSLEALRTLMLQAIKDVESKLERLERDFYCGLKCDVFLLQLHPTFQEVMKKFQVTFFHASWQIDDILRRNKKFGDEYGVDKIMFSKFKEFGEKLHDFFPARFDEFVEDIQRIVNFLKKYCLSFLEGTHDPLIESAVHYEERKENFIGVVNEELNNIKEMGIDYKNKGLTAKCFSAYVNQIGRKSGCSYMPLLLGFPQACYNIRSACQEVVKWVNTDQHYPEFIKNDIEELEEKRVTQVNDVRKARMNNVLLEHKHKSLQKDVVEMEAKVNRLKPRAEKLAREVTELQKQIHHIRLDMNVKEEDLEDLKLKLRRGSTCSSAAQSDYTERLEMTSNDLVRMRLTTYILNRQVEAKITKEKRIQEKQIALDALKKEAARCGKMTLVSKTAVVLAVREIQKIERCLGQLKDIYMKRTCPDITRKIFHNLPIETRSSTKSSPWRAWDSDSVTSAKSTNVKTDILQRVCLLAAKHIGSDWPKVYRLLAFFPRRGEANLDSDIDELIKTHYRSDHETAARAALARWRRLHSRASVADLKRALSSANKRDVIHKIETLLKPKQVKDLPVNRRQRHVRKAISRFLMLKHMGMTMPTVQATHARQGPLRKSAMTCHVTQSDETRRAVSAV